MSGTSAWILLKTGQCALLAGILLLPQALRAQLRSVEQRTANGVLEGVISADGKVRTFKGIPYAAPPVGPLRWKAPQPAAAWTGVRKATEYPARCMQAPIYPDMIFHDNGPSEDCLYLNLWMPAAPAQPRLPVMVWIYGGRLCGGSNFGTTAGRRQPVEEGRAGSVDELPAGDLRIFGASGVGQGIGA